MTSYAAFETALGPIALAWTGDAQSGAIVALQLPAADAAATVAQLRARLPYASSAVRIADGPDWLRAAIAAMRRHVGGEPQDLSSIPVALDGCTAFQRRVYAATCAIPSGRAATYGEVAQRAGAPRAMRAVGAALGRNPVPLIVPCHRVIAAGGRPGGFSAPGGLATKAQLLRIEGYL